MEFNRLPDRFGAGDWANETEGIAAKEAAAHSAWNKRAMTQLRRTSTK
jgi:hypothetical protein